MGMKNETSGTDLNRAADQRSRADRLEYVADLLSELQDIAAEEGCEMLAGLLNLSQTESRRQARNFRSR